jgi:23S rRNA (uridine2552-2'-O)-methyltransferase
VYPYQQDITDADAVKKILSIHNIEQVDVIISDMAPNTIGVKDIDAIRSFDLLEQWFWMFEYLLKKDGKAVVKVFMGPGFDQYVKRMKDLFGGKSIKIYKPDASRTNSKETYVVKV